MTVDEVYRRKGGLENCIRLSDLKISVYRRKGGLEKKALSLQIHYRVYRRKGGLEIFFMGRGI